MSLVVGIACEDGVVIACDCASTARANGVLTRQKFFCDKFRLDSQDRWACAWAGSRASIIASTKIGRTLRAVTAPRRLSSEELIEHLQSIGNEAFEERKQEDPRLSETACCLVAYDHGSIGVLGRVELYELSVARTSTCTRINPGSPKYVGDYVNPAAFFGWSLYTSVFHQRASVDEAAFLAGFTVTAAHNFNPLSVDGLSVLLCRPENFSVVDEMLAEEIKKQSDEVGNEIWNNIRQRCTSFREKMCHHSNQPASF